MPTMTGRISLTLMGAALAGLLAGCSGMLPRQKEVTASPWPTYQAAQETFDKIVPGQTTIADLRNMALDPAENPNIAILNYADVMRKFMLNQSFSVQDLDQGVRDCVMAKVACRGFEVTQSMVNKDRQGNVVLDVLGFYRETQTTGWRLKGPILPKEHAGACKLPQAHPHLAGT